jgi:CDP-6-deoxy-D-xylo-4-hexulose-3-dehydrase
MIETRPLMAGNIAAHPSMKNVKHKIVGNLTNSDVVKERSFFIGTYPGITKEMREWQVKCIVDFIENKRYKT